MNTEQERAELLPCPFCGGTNIEIQISTPDREGVPTNLMCSDCGASGPWEYEQGNSHAKADDAWNRRAALQSQDREDAATEATGGDENGGHRLVEPDHETALALADAPRSLRNYVAALRSAIAAPAPPAGRAALQSQDREDEPLQPAANWLIQAIEGCTVGDIQGRLSIGYNRAKRLFDHARRAERSGE